MARAACDLGKNLPEGANEGIEVDTMTGEVKPLSAEACIAPGEQGDDEECDWSADDSEVEVVQAHPASEGKFPLEPTIEEEEGDDPMTGEDALVGGPPPPMETEKEEKDADMEAEGTTTFKKGVETLEPKAEEIVEGDEPLVRRRKIKFGSAHLHLLKAVADADAHNWESLQTALKATPSTAQAKSELVNRLEHLADLRVQSIVAAERRAQEHAQRAKHYTEEETRYQRGLNDEMLRLEQMNPVGPRSSVPLISDARLKQDIEAGKPIWQARREHRSRERAARKRSETAGKRTTDTSQPSRLTEVPPEEGGQVLDAAFSESAQANLAEFKQLLREEAREEKKQNKRKPDSERRKKIKKERRKERKANTRDDAERDRNHAIAHHGTGSVASFLPGLQGVLVASTPTLSKGLGYEIESAPEEAVYPFDMASGMAFDLVMMMLFLGLVWAGVSLVLKLKHRLGEGRRTLPPKNEVMSPARKVGGTRKKVRFTVPRKSRAAQPSPETPFLGGPKAAKRRHPPGNTMRLATIQGRHEFDQEGFALLLSRYSQNTATSYQSQWGWWALFCRRRGEDPVRYIPAYNRSEEQLVLDYLVHCSTNEAKAPGTIKLRLAALTSMHLTLGYPDPLAHMPRVPLALCL
eukprot:s1182_g12.t1